MATSSRTAEYLLEQLAGAGDCSVRRMFGEYALYYDTKVVGFICDDQLFLKQTGAGRNLLTEVTLGKPYPGAKDYFLVPGDQWEDPEHLGALVRATAEALPLPTPKKPRTRRSKSRTTDA